MKHEGRVVPTKDTSRRLKFYLRTNHRRQLEGECGTLILRVPPLMQSVRAGVMEWVLEQGQGMRSWGQQHVVHGRARRTVDCKQQRYCAA